MRLTLATVALLAASAVTAPVDVTKPVDSDKKNNLPVKKEKDPAPVKKEPLPVHKDLATLKPLNATTTLLPLKLVGNDKVALLSK